jgi:Lon-like protease
MKAVPWRHVGDGVVGHSHRRDAARGAVAVLAQSPTTPVCTTGDGGGVRPIPGRPDLRLSARGTANTLSTVLPEATQTPDDRPSSLSRRSTTLIVTIGLGVLLVALAALLPVPYVALSPGPTANTLGSEEGMELITIEGRETYATSGHLQLTTVRVSGGPDSSMDLLSALRGWIDPEVAVVPIDRVYPPDETAEEVEQRTAEEMELSQQDATAAALRALDIPVTSEVAVGSVLEDAPAQGKLEAGDVIISVDGVPAVSPDVVRDAVRSKEPGDTVTFVVSRDGDELEVSVVTGPSSDDADVAAVGIAPVVAFSYPFTVEIQLEDVGGPSAGLMFALGIYDKLTPGELTGGEFIAGTGEIDADGQVGPIGGIQQKLIAAREEGASAFLTPAGNCEEAVGAVPDGLRLVRVETLDDAVQALDRIRFDEADVPTCSR